MIYAMGSNRGRFGFSAIKRKLVHLVLQFLFEAISYIMNINHSVLGRVSVFLSVASFSVMVILVKYITSLFFIPAIEIAFFRFFARLFYRTYDHCRKAKKD